MEILKTKVKDYYDTQTEYHEKMYSENPPDYPHYQQRLGIVLERLSLSKSKSVLESGCGTGIPMIELLNRGFYTKGFDFSEKMIARAKENLKKHNYDPDLAKVGDMEKLDTYSEGTFDSIISLGSLSHCPNEKLALRNFHSKLNENGKIYLELSNKLFGLFSLNKVSQGFFKELMNYDKQPGQIQNLIDDHLSKRLFDERPRSSLNHNDCWASNPRFHNPLTIKDLLEETGFEFKKIIFYHYHAFPPKFEDVFRDYFHSESLKLEETNDWRGYFLASAFVVEASKLK